MDELEWIRKKYPNAKRFKTETHKIDTPKIEMPKIEITKTETKPQKPINDKFCTSTPRLDERCGLFWGILDTHNMDKIHPKKISYMKKCRKWIKVHHEEMKDDPERLTTNFLVKMTGCVCKK